MNSTALLGRQAFAMAASCGQFPHESAEPLVEPLERPTPMMPVEHLAGPAVIEPTQHPEYTLEQFSGARAAVMTLLGLGRLLAELEELLAQLADLVLETLDEAAKTSGPFALPDTVLLGRVVATAGLPQMLAHSVRQSTDYTPPFLGQALAIAISDALLKLARNASSPLLGQETDVAAPGTPWNACAVTTACRMAVRHTAMTMR